jgi:hypothetical protein
MFSKKIDGVKVGKIVRRLGFRSFGFGNLGWMWKNVCFSDFSISWRAGINPHIVIVGESGGGKSNAAKILVERLCSSGANVVILDPHNEYLGSADEISADIYDAAYNGINLFDLDGMSEREKAGELAGLFRRNFRLGEVQSYTLYRCIMNTYSYLGQFGKVPNLRNLLFTISVFKKNAKAGERSVLESLEKRLAAIDSGPFSKSTDIERVMTGNSLFLLSGLHTAEAQSIYLEGFLRKIYSRMLLLEKSGRPFLYIVIDEAEKLGDNPILGKIAAEGRKYGVGIIATSQRSKALDRDLRNNSSLLVSFYMREPEELNYISNFIAGGNELGRFAEVKKGIRSLGRGYAMVLDSSQRNPYIVHFDCYGRRNTSVRFSILQNARAGIERGELGSRMEGICNPEELSDSVALLVQKKELHQCVIEKGRHSGVWYISNPHNSAEHDICVNAISRYLSGIGVPNRVYDSSYGPDVIANFNRRKIAVEYETGLKSIEDTKAMLAKRSKYYQKIIVVVNDRAYENYRKSFGNVIAFSEIERIRDAISAP